MHISFGLNFAHIRFNYVHVYMIMYSNNNTEMTLLLVRALTLGLHLITHQYHHIVN